MAVELRKDTMTEEEFRLLKDVIYEHCGIHFRDEMRFLVERRLVPRLRLHRLESFGEYYRFLRFNSARKDELEAAVEALTTNETYFFRESNQLLAFTEEILPVLAAEKAQTRRLRIWSAGCSSGEECFTIAMLLLDSHRFEGWDVEIFGTDISRRMLAQARTGHYGASAFRSTEPALRDRWFHQRGTKWEIDEAVRRIVSFGHLNLIDAEMINLVGRADAIFCRNVMIYFDVSARQRVLRSFYDKLNPGGYLFLGHSESLINVTADYELLHLKHDLVYRKPRIAAELEAT